MANFATDCMTGANFAMAPVRRVVAIGEAAGDEDRVAALEVFGGVPEVGDRLVGNRGDNVVSIVVAVGAGEDQNAEFHTLRISFAWRRYTGA